MLYDGGSAVRRQDTRLMFHKGHLPSRCFCKVWCHWHRFNKMTRIYPPSVPESKISICLTADNLTAADTVFQATGGAIQNPAESVKYKSNIINLTNGRKHRAETRIIGPSASKLGCRMFLVPRQK